MIILNIDTTFVCEGPTVSGDGAFVEAYLFVCDGEDKFCTGSWSDVMSNGDECKG